MSESENLGQKDQGFASALYHIVRHREMFAAKVTSGVRLEPPNPPSST